MDGENVDSTTGWPRAKNSAQMSGRHDMTGEAFAARRIPPRCPASPGRADDAPRRRAMRFAAWAWMVGAAMAHGADLYV